MSPESRCIFTPFLLKTFQIIKRARQNYLFDQWKASNPSKEAIIELAKNGIARFQKKHDEEEDQDKKKMYFDHLTKANAAVQGKLYRRKLFVLTTRDQDPDGEIENFGKKQDTVSWILNFCYIQVKVFDLKLSTSGSGTLFIFFTFFSWQRTC